jgi:hypothetical protein
MARRGPAARSVAAPSREAKARRGAPWGDDRGQMMLLSAFVFVIGLLALSAALSRVSLLAGETLREQDRPVIAHVTPMVEAVDAALLRLETEFQPTLVPGTAEYDAAIEGLLRHLEAIEAEQGFVLDWSLDCETPDPATAYANLVLRDATTSFEARTRTFTLSDCP